jgi:hypothetical protein
MACADRDTIATRRKRTRDARSFGEFSAPLDLVIDDGSHAYEPAKGGFETLFPLLRPGSLNVIEDWAWEHWAPYQKPDHPWAKKKSLRALAFQLVEATGSSPHLIESLTVSRGFAVVERGAFSPRQLGNFKLERHISRRPQVEGSMNEERQSTNE